jgi:hypothetical protein
MADDCADKIKQAMRQVETPLNKGPAQKVRSPNSTPGSATRSPASLGVHKDPYRKG